jgi:hypothetical protein
MKSLVACVVLFAGCFGQREVPVGTGDMFEAPTNSASRCADVCHEIGLPLDSVVVMANNVGCVCGAAALAPAPGTEPVSTRGSAAGAASGGMVAILLTEEAARRRRSSSRSTGIRH